MEAAQLDYNEALARIVAHIELAALEKVEEIDLATEEAFKVEMTRIYIQSVRNISDEYRNKCARLTGRILREHNFAVATHRTSFLWAQRRVIEAVMEEAVHALHHHLQHNPKVYADLLCDLLVSALCRMHEPRVLVCCRQMDLDLMKDVVPRAKQKYKKMVGQGCTVYRHPEYLPQKSLGGVEVLRIDERIKVCNTVYDRFMTVVQNNQVDIRKMLFPVSR